MSSSAPSNRSKRLCSAFYFTSVIPNDVSKNGQWVCNKCGKTKLKSGGWTNLLNHLRSTFVGETYAADFDKIQPDRTRITSYVLRASDAENDMFKWIEWLVMKNLRLSMIDCPLTRAAIRFKPVTSKSLRKHILSLCRMMKEDIKAKIPERFAVIFDGWTEGTTHYIGVSVSYAALPAGGAKEGGRDVVTQTLLFMRPLLTGEVNRMTAQDHMLHLSLVLQTFG